jgi:hypothetical protein
MFSFLITLYLRNKVILELINANFITRLAV